MYYDILEPPIKRGDERLKSMSLSMAAAACGGKLVGCGDGSVPIRRAVIDSRTVEPGDLFVAYRGEKTDGHRYIQTALDKGAACCLAEYAPEGVQGPLILCDDVQKAFEAIAREYRQSLALPVVGVTGSVGKTTTKEMISAVLARRYRVLKTEGNLNNQIGVPMTVSRLEQEHEAAVIELGISDFGEMRLLASIARPTIAVFTVIGRAHLEFLHDLDGVFKAKTEMLELLPADGVVIYNGDDAQLRKIDCAQKRVSYGFGEDCTLRASEVSLSKEGRTRARIECGERCIHADIPAFGRQMVYAALAAAAVGMELGLSDAEIEAGLASYATVGRRGAIADTGFLTLVDDSYNANPESMRAAMDSLALLPGRHVCILGDMLEMGPDSAQMHYDLGAYAREKGMDLILCCGPLCSELARGAGENSRYFENTEQLRAALPELLKEGDAVLVKASRGMHLETIAEAIKVLKLS